LQQNCHPDRSVSAVEGPAVSLPVLTQTLKALKAVALYGTGKRVPYVRGIQSSLWDGALKSPRPAIRSVRMTTPDPSL
jgi:hypothetical protein